jgi:hypothetical protein
MLEGIRWIALLAVVGVSTAIEAATPVARIVPSRTTCTAPCAVYFDGRTSSDADLLDRADNLLDLTYVWDFGDPGSGTWAQGARAGTASPHPRNADTGFVAGHVYENAGTYTARLTVFDGTSSASATTQITVADGNATWPGTQTVCIANGALPVAGQGGCPSGAAVANSGDFDAVLVANQCHSASRRCLFRRGDSFTASQRVSLTSGGPNLIGAYGTGAKPLVTLPAGATSIFQFDQGNYDFRIADLQMRGNDASDSTAIGIGLAGNHPIRRMLLLRLDISHFDNQLALRGITDGWTPDVNISNENAIVDSTILDGPGLGGNDLFVLWERSMFLGNRIGDKFDLQGDRRGEHIIRARYTAGAVWNHNAMGLLNDTGGRIGCGDIRHVMKVVSDIATDFFPNGVSHENVFTDNYVSSCKSNSWDLDIGRRDSTPLAADQGHRIFLVERNFFTKRFSDGSSVSLQVEGEEGVVRNNVFDLSGPNQDSGQTGVRVWNRAPVDPAPVPTRDVRVYNNTCYRDAATPGAGTCISLTSDSSRAIVRNNLMYEAGAGQASQLLSDGGVGTVTCSGCNAVAAANPFAVASPRVVSDFALAAAASPIDDGLAVPGVPMNFDSGGVQPRDGDSNGTAQYDLGAFEGGGGTGGGGGGGTAPAAPVLLD